MILKCLLCDRDIIGEPHICRDYWGEECYLHIYCYRDICESGLTDDYDT